MLKKAFAAIVLALVGFVVTPTAANAAGYGPTAADAGYTVSFLVIWAAAGTLIFAVSMVIVLASVRRQRANTTPLGIRTATA